MADEDVLMLGLVGLLLAPFILLGMALYGLLLSLPVAAQGIQDGLRRQDEAKEREKDREIERLKIKLKQTEMEFRRLEAEKPRQPVFQNEVAEQWR